jgi:hypothetical protein
MHHANVGIARQKQARAKITMSQPGSKSKIRNKKENAVNIALVSGNGEFIFQLSWR